MKILVTGAFGYLGGRISFHFSQLGHEIIMASRTKKQKPDWLCRGKVITIDWDNIYSLRDACKDVNLVIHTAGINSEESAKNPELAYKINAIGTRELFKAAQFSDVNRFVYISTAHVYSAPLVGSISEVLPTTNNHPYATSNLDGEKFILIESQKKIKSIVLRLSNAFGAPIFKEAGCWSLLANDLCRQVAISRKIILNSSGQQMRNFIPISDIMQGLEKLLFTSLNHNNYIFNLGSDLNMSVYDFSEIVAKVAHKNLGYLPVIIRKKNTHQLNNLPFTYEIGKIKELGYLPKNLIENEINDTINFCFDNF